jgi:hypothetical protein
MMSDPSIQQITASHYETHADKDSYEDAYFYEPGAYMQYLVQLTKDRLCLDESTSTHQRSRRFRRILDIGGGTGNFAKSLIQSASTTTNNNVIVEVIVVDPFLDPTTITTSCYNDVDEVSEALKFVKASAENFLENGTTHDGNNVSVPWWRESGSYHQVLMKEIVHHLDAKDRVGIFRGIHQGLAQVTQQKQQHYERCGASTATNDNHRIPSLLIITRPQVAIDYPLWEEARQVWKINQPSVEELVHDLQEAGFTDIQYTLESYPCHISLQRWKSMVKNRFWSTFSNFSDDELVIASKHIELDYHDRIDDHGNIHFEDRLLFLTACK